jgi:M6 family metalloprotease-like protein
VTGSGSKNSKQKIAKAEVMKRILKKHCGTLLLLAVLLGLAAPAPAVLVENSPIILVQPDGQSLCLFLTGDEFHHRVYDKAGYTIVKDPASGVYVYADKENGRLIPGSLVAGRDDPAGAKLVPGLDDDPFILQQAREALPYMAGQGAKTPSIGNINNIVVFVSFADQTEFPDTSGSLNHYGRTFNDSTGTTNSLRNYFYEVSYKRLTVRSTLYPLSGDTFVVSYQDINNRSYYCPYDSTTNPGGYTGGNNSYDRATREHALLKRAIQTISSQVPAGLDIDADDDGYVDNVCFVIRGPTTAWATLLWSHRWAIYYEDAYINGKKVWDYNFQMQSQFNVGVLCHEMGHSVGYPDLYHYYYGTSLSPTGIWDIMCSTPNPPAHSSSYLKYYYTGWVDSLPEITTAGTYWLRPLADSAGGSCYKIVSPNSASEYYMVEYRRRMGIYENSLYGSGLLVYRINSNFAGDGNAYYDGSTTFDEVYLYRPGGTVSANGTLSTAFFSEGSARNAINDATNPTGFLHDGALGGLDIYDIGAAGDSICFTVGFPAGVSGGPGPAALTHGTRFISCGPNPAEGFANIRFETEKRSAARLDIYAISGHKAASLELGSREPGQHSVKLDLRDNDGKRLPAGIYIIRLSSGNLRATGRLVVIK